MASLSSSACACGGSYGWRLVSVHPATSAATTSPQPAGDDRSRADRIITGSFRAGATATGEAERDQQAEEREGGGGRAAAHGTAAGRRRRAVGDHVDVAL